MTMSFSDKTAAIEIAALDNLDALKPGAVSANAAKNEAGSGSPTAVTAAAQDEQS